MVENTYESIEGALRPLIVDDASAAEVYSALHDVAWVALSSTATNYSEASDLSVEQEQPCFTWGWRAAGDFIAEARGEGETYLDVFWELDVRSGEVSERVRRIMESLGLKPVL
jgi:hypothetical protein